MNHRNNRRSESTKNKIKQALVEMLAEQEPGKITVQSLCEKAGVNRSTFYNHYHSPQSVLNNMGKDYITSLRTYLEDLKFFEEPSADPATVLTKILEFLQQDKNMCFLLLSRNLNPNFRRTVFQGMLELSLMPHPVFEKYPEETLHYTTAFILYGAGHAINLWLQEDCKESPQEIAALITGFLDKL